MCIRDRSITDWLRQYSKDTDETYVRSFLGRMLFSGEEALKAVNVLSGGEKVRCVLAKMMLSGANFLIMDEPTNHLDMESITALNDGMVKFPGNMIFTSHDHQLMQTVEMCIRDSFFIFLLFLFGNKLYKMITLAKKVNNIYKYFRLNLSLIHI